MFDDEAVVQRKERLLRNEGLGALGVGDVRRGEIKGREKRVNIRAINEAIDGAPPGEKPVSSVLTPWVFAKEKASSSSTASVSRPLRLHPSSLRPELTIDREWGKNGIGKKSRWRGVSSLAEFPALFKRIQPYLIAVNLNGMRGDTSQYPGVRYIGSDESELAMIRVVEASGWRGPIGVIHERPTVDAAEGIKGNLQGLEWIQKEMHQRGSGGPKPQEPTPPTKVLPKPASSAKPQPDTKNAK